MSQPAAQPPPAAEDGWAAERWAYAGHAAGRTQARVAVWYDGNRTRMLFTPDKGRRLVPGGEYEVTVRRADGDVTRRGEPRFAGRHPDKQWAAALEAEAYAGERDIARGAAERRARRDTVLSEAIDPLERLAAGMTYAQRDALAAMVTRRIYRAGREAAQLNPPTTGKDPHEPRPVLGRDRQAAGAGRHGAQCR